MIYRYITAIIKYSYVLVIQALGYNQKMHKVTVQEFWLTLTIQELPRCPSSMPCCIFIYRAGGVARLVESQKKQLQAGEENAWHQSVMTFSLPTRQLKLRKTAVHASE